MCIRDRHQVEPVFPGRFALDEQFEPVEAPDGFEPVERACRFGDMVELFPDELGVGDVYKRQTGIMPAVPNK